MENSSQCNTSGIELRDYYGNLITEEYLAYQKKLAEEDRCCFCGEVITGWEERIYSRLFRSDMKPTCWHCCQSCLESAEIQMESLKKYPMYNVTAYRSLLESLIDRQARRKDLTPEQEQALQSKREEKKRYVYQNTIRLMEPFLKKHAAAPDCADQILNYVHEQYHMNPDHHYVNLRAAQDKLTIYEDGGACSFFDDGGSVTWHKEWNLWYIRQSSSTTTDHRCQGIPEPISMPETTSDEPLYENPFGLSGIFCMKYDESEEKD